LDRQRGNGAFESSIRGLRRLNALGYGDQETRLILNLVYNSRSVRGRPRRPALGEDYGRVAGDSFGIKFNHLFTSSNMLIQRSGTMGQPPRASSTAT
jgi:hypothetical protein